MIDQGVPPPEQDQHFALPEEAKNPEAYTETLKSQPNVVELKSEPKPSKEKTKKEQKKKEKKPKEKKEPSKKQNKTLWMSILVISSIILAFSLIILGLCISHKWMNASFIPALSG